MQSWLELEWRRTLPLLEQVIEQNSNHNSHARLQSTAALKASCSTLPYSSFTARRASHGSTTPRNGQATHGSVQAAWDGPRCGTSTHDAVEEATWQQVRLNRASYCRLQRAHRGYRPRPARLRCQSFHLANAPLPSPTSIDTRYILLTPTITGRSMAWRRTHWTCETRNRILQETQNRRCFRLEQCNCVSSTRSEYSSMTHPDSPADRCIQLLFQHQHKEIISREIQEIRNRCPCGTLSNLGNCLTATHNLICHAYAFLQDHVYTSGSASAFYLKETLLWGRAV